MTSATDTTNTAEQPYTYGTWVTSTDGTVRVSFDHIGEGFEGDYDETDPDDAPLLRLDVEVAAQHSDKVWGEETDDPNWVYPSDGSICTQVNMDTTDDATLRDLLAYAAASLSEAVTSGTTSVKSEMDRLSYLPVKR